MTYSKPLYRRLLLSMFSLVAVLAMTSCEDQLLDKKPRGELTQASFFETKQHAVKATNATYEKMRDFWVHSFGWIGMTDIASDDAKKGSTPSDAPAQREFDEFTVTPTNALLEFTWQGYYQGIFRANLAIKNIPSIDMNPTLRSRLVGENKFLRAYYYFFLVRAFGGVPLIKEPLKPGEFRQPRASASQVYNFIEQDLNDAVKVLPVKSNYSPANLGRATKGAARGLLAKVHLFQGEYQQALQMAEAVINSGEYSLLSDYSKIFTPEGENSSESLFEIQAVSNKQGMGGTPYSVVQGVRGTPNLGWGFNNPTRDLMKAYAPGDPRMQSTILFVHEQLPRGPEGVVRDNPNMIDERYNQKSFIKLNSAGGNWNGGSNIRRLRYADVLLIAAESAYHVGQISKARTYVNQVRARARGNREVTLGITPGVLSSVLADTIGSPSMENHVFIRYANPGGAAAQAGLKNLSWKLVDNSSKIVVENLDIIKSVDGVTVTTISDFKNEMKKKNAGQQVTVTVERITQTFKNGQRQTNSQQVVATISARKLLPRITSSGRQLLKDIWHERRVELAMEQHRMFDLQRQGRAAEQLQDLGVSYNPDKHSVYPIPQAELDLNSKMEQNPGY